mmetsp:Transcript_28984/g.79514  ORF Transcript_28984/g.79514 Transcript_28984/m.79514 type:complete len:322 (+) Transcript_28984:87-1052(+)
MGTTSEANDIDPIIGSIRAAVVEKSSNTFLLFLSTSLCLVVALAWFFSQRRFKALDQEASSARALRAEQRAKRAENPFSTSSEEKRKESEGNNVWKDRRRKGVVPASSSSKAKPSEKAGDKPFHSSYYYAHNSSNSKGGYSDGLSLEDYDMNKPRLLARGGKPVIEEVADDAEESAIDDPEPSAKDKPSTREEDRSSRKMSLKISKYSWDDPGDSRGVATIRIDCLPSEVESSSNLVPWPEANVTEATAELINGSKGLLVVVKTDRNGVEYQLEMMELYGSVSSVKAINKSKRLVVKLQKTTGFLYRKNLEPWPLPVKRVS